MPLRPLRQHAYATAATSRHPLAMVAFVVPPLTPSSRLLSPFAGTPSWAAHCSKRRHSHAHRFADSPVTRCPGCTRRTATCLQDPFAWIANGVVSATATVWAVVAEKTLSALPGGGGNKEAAVGEGEGDGRGGEKGDGLLADGGGRYDGRALPLRPAQGRPVAAAVVDESDFGNLLFDDAGDGDDDGLLERLAARDTGSGGSGDVRVAGTGRRRAEEARASRTTPEQLRAQKEKREVDRRQGTEKRPRGGIGNFFLFGRGAQAKGAAGAAVGSAVSYGGLEQARVVALVNAALQVRNDAPLDTPIPYPLQRELFSELRAVDARPKQVKKPAAKTKPAPGSRVVVPVFKGGKEGGMKPTISISRDVLRPVGISASKGLSGTGVLSTEVLGRIQRDIGNLDREESDETKGKRRKGKKRKKGGAEVHQASENGWFGFFGRKSQPQAKPDEIGPADLAEAGGSQADVSASRENVGDSAMALQSGRNDDSEGAPAPVRENDKPLHIPLGMVGDLLNAVWRVKGHEQSAEKELEERSKKENVAAYAAAMTRDFSVMEETDLSGGGAATAFAAASAIATSNQASQLDAIEAAGLHASVAAARAISSIEDADLFVDTVGVGALVTAARVLTGQARSSSLTALANIAIMRPKSRGDMLSVDAGSLVGSIASTLVESTRFKAVSKVVVDKTTAMRRMESLVSGAHLLGSLALAEGELGAEWRRRMATDSSLLSSLKKLTGGAKNGEPEGAARAARRALGALGNNVWTPRVPGQRGLRILSIDGGGTRAIMAFEMLKHLEMLTGSTISEMFDVIGGTSTGAIVAASLGIAHKSVEEVEALYRRLIGKIFLKNEGPIAGPVQVSKLLLTKAYYDTAVLEESLKRECGTGVFIDSLAEEGMNKVFVVSSIMSRSPQELHVFRNYTYPLSHESRYEGTAEAQLWEALRASSAAPTFFSEILVNGELHADGAIVANNPTAVALHETKCMYPGVPIECVVSMGNGLTAAEIAAAVASSPNQVKAQVKAVGWGDVVGSM
jgi:predicted acylesterase/phospholipase RssA